MGKVSESTIFYKYVNGKFKYVIGLSQAKSHRPSQVDVIFFPMHIIMHFQCVCVDCGVECSDSMSMTMCTILASVTVELSWNAFHIHDIARLIL